MYSTQMGSQQKTHQEQTNQKPTEQQLNLVRQWSRKMVVRIPQQLFLKNFASIKELTLSDSLPIDSIEGLHRINFVSLKTLDRMTNRNSIISIKDLRKNMWPQLQQINIKSTKILDPEYFIEFFNKFERIILENAQGKYLCDFQSLHWLLRIPISELKSISYPSFQVRWRSGSGQAKALDSTILKGLKDNVLW